LLGLVVGVVAVLFALLQGDNEPPQVIGSDGRDIVITAEEVSEVADTGGNPLDGARALALRLGTDTISCQCI